MITLLLPVCVGVCVTAALLVHGPLRRRTFGRAVTRLRRPATTPGRSLPEVFDVLRLGLAAALLDLGNHLMLCAEERRAFRLRKRLSSARVRRLGVAAAALRAGARRPDDITLEIPIGERTQEGNPRRTLALSCVVYEPLGHHASDPPEDDGASLFWRVESRPSPGHRGPSVTVDVPDLDKALICYHARPLRPAGGATGRRFFDEGTHDEPAP